MKESKEEEEKKVKTEENLFKSLNKNRKLLGDNFADEESVITDKALPIKEENKSKRPWQVYLVLFSFIIVVVMVILSIKYAPKITLNGEKNMVLNYREEYQDPGYKVVIDGRDYTDKIKIKGKVNSKKLGTYKIEYSYRNGIFISTEKRIVKVEDLQKPVIMLSGGKEVYVCPGKEYKDSYKAIDNYDGDITDKVLVEKKDGKYIYKVKDRRGNTSIITRKVIEKDRTKPNIVLNGDRVINLQIGNTYNEEGYSARDNCDEDITSNVLVEKNIDVNKIGKYEIKYKVKDKSGNDREAVRVVNILEPPKKGIIYLTFDDGPQEGTTDVILDILKEENVLATFFVTSRGPDYLIKREYNENHSVALHTSSHNYATLYSSDEAFFNDLESVQRRVKNITGYDSKIIRFPGGSSNTISRKYSVGIMSRLTKEVLNRGYKYYDWNISSGDAGDTTSSEGVYQNVITRLRHDKVNMILMHDIKSFTRDALRQIIKYGKENGYTFEKITESTDMIKQRVNN